MIFPKKGFSCSPFSRFMEFEIRSSLFLGFNACGIHLPVFWIYPIACKGLGFIFCDTPNCLADSFCVYDESSPTNVYNFLCITFSRALLWSWLLTSKPSSLKCQSQNLHVLFDTIYSTRTEQINWHGFAELYLRPNS